MRTSEEMDPILVVEDSRAVSLALSLFAQQRGLAVECASEEAEAIALLTHKRYSGVVLDLRLGEVETPNGLHILEFLYRNRPGTPALVLTAFGTPLLAEEARRLGAVAFLTKPVDNQALHRALDALLGARQ